MKVDRASETWAAVSALSKKEQSRALEALMDRRTSHEDTQYYRGVLDMIRRLDEIDRLDVPIAAETLPGY